MGKKSKSKQVPKEWMYLFHSLSTQGIDPRSLLHPNSFVTAVRNLAVTVALVEDDAMTECTQIALERTDPEPPRKQAKQESPNLPKRSLSIDLAPYYRTHQMNDAPSGSKSKKK
ncbi:hypothetical protein JB92DRAFT_2837707 [Gautieria morchelliformis]|nr:hypothetical protein JB92DRAFT_2837707 [Gautieria morchelliformis]